MLNEKTITKLTFQKVSLIDSLKT